MNRRPLLATLGVSVFGFLFAFAQENNSNTPRDAVANAQQSQAPKTARPEQKKNAHDSSTVFGAANAKPSSPAFKEQAKEGKITGFDFYKDPLGADAPNQNPDEMIRQLMDAKPKVMAAQRQLLENRYDLAPRLDPSARMS